MCLKPFFGKQDFSIFAFLLFTFLQKLFLNEHFVFFEHENSHCMICAVKRGVVTIDFRCWIVCVIVGVITWCKVRGDILRLNASHIVSIFFLNS